MNRNEKLKLLNWLMNKEIEKIRKIVRPYKRDKSIFYSDVIIDYKDLSDINAVGLYEWDEENYKHHIYIDTKHLQGYIDRMHSKDWCDKYMNRRVCNTIGHELTHAYVRQAFGRYRCSIDGVNNDGSPVFLATLKLFGYSSGHHCSYNFWKGDLSKKTNNIMLYNTRSHWWKLFKKEIMNYIKSIETFRNEFNKEEDNKIKSGQLGNVNNISFSFSNRGSGLRKNIQISNNSKLLNDGKLKELNISSINFNIGSAMQNIEQIKKLVIKKINNNVYADITNISYYKFNEKHLVYENYKKIK